MHGVMDLLYEELSVLIEAILAQSQDCIILSFLEHLLCLALFLVLEEQVAHFRRFEHGEENLQISLHVNLSIHQLLPLFLSLAALFDQRVDNFLLLCFELPDHELDALL